MRSPRSGSWTARPRIQTLRALRLPRLRELYLSRTQITDAGLKHLAASVTLQKLDLFDTQVGDEGLRSIAKLTTLVRLGLGNTKVTDRGVELLKALPQLQELYLSGTAVTDNGMLAIGQIGQLRSLDLFDTSVTSAGVQHLRRFGGPGASRLGGQPCSRRRRKDDLGADRTEIPFPVAVAGQRRGRSCLRAALPGAKVDWRPGPARPAGR